MYKKNLLSESKFNHKRKGKRWEILLLHINHLSEVSLAVGPLVISRMEMWFVIFIFFFNSIKSFGGYKAIFEPDNHFHLNQISSFLINFISLSRNQNHSEVANDSHRKKWIDCGNHFEIHFEGARIAFRKHQNHINGKQTKVRRRQKIVQKEIKIFYFNYQETFAQQLAYFLLNIWGVLKSSNLVGCKYVKKH